MKIPAVPEKYRNLLVPAFLLAFFLFSLALRGIPALSTPANGFIPTYDSDTWYTLRQVEVMVHSFPQYNWFDPMTAFPTGKVIDWGPLYPLLAAVLCIAAGAVARTPLIDVSMWLGPILGACLVPVMYLLGKAMFDRKAGLAAAALVSFVSYRLFFLSSYGFADHHIAEVLTTSLLVLAYVAALASMRDRPLDLARPRSLAVPVALSLLCGVIYFAALAASTTVVIVLMVLGIYTVVQMVADTVEGKPVRDYLLLNAGTGLAAIACLLVFGIRVPGFSLGQYSAGQVMACAGFIAVTLAIALIAAATRGRRRLFLGACTAVLAAGLLALLTVPALGELGSQVLQFFSVSNIYSEAIQEMLPWTPGTAWQNFNLFLLLGAGGLVLLALRVRGRRRREEVLLGTWMVALLLLTLLHGRFEYYLAVPLVLLSALCVAEAVSRGILPALPSGPGQPAPGGKEGSARKGKARKGRVRQREGPKDPTSSDKAAKNPTWSEPPSGGVRPPRPAPKESGKRGDRGTLPTAMAAVVLVALAAGTALSLWVDVQSGTQIQYDEIPGDWIEALNWMSAHTPSPGVDYFGRYDPVNFTYPAGSYGVMAIWDAGHWVTFFGKRIPNVNPFQDNLPGPDGGAAFLLSPSEAEAGRILDRLGTGFVVTDIWTATDKFTTQVPWIDPAVNTTPYERQFFIPDADNAAQLDLVTLYDNAYFQSMVVRLENFDGTLALPTTAQYVEYTTRRVPGPGETAPGEGIGDVITRIEDRDAAVAARDAASANANPLFTGEAVALSDRPDRPLSKLPALTHFRLVHESPANVTWDLYTGESVPTDISYVKVFEYVKGAHIRGTGTIEVPLVTNTGRRFTYRQESANGEFVVPYPTQGNLYDVKATGPYRIAGSTGTYEVSEDDVLNGRTVG
ncbi:MAG TPA: oligosaccharyl transferase, archaeosortase A system-associated [Methanomicrobiales archaeon]|nr:oligosaccharyl transferase, archaeosortase A system-associated [Methanomicrobiales archaeon]